MPARASNRESVACAWIERPSVRDKVSGARLIREIAKSLGPRAATSWGKRVPGVRFYPAVKMLRALDRLSPPAS
jgi:hypothetical protein